MLSLKPFKNFRPKFEAVGCFLECGGEFLLLERQSHKPQGDTWGLPSGTIEEGETPIGAMLRELKEETGYVTTLSSLEHIRTVYVRFESGEDFIYHIYRVVLEERPEVTVNFNEHKKCRWVLPLEALSMKSIQDLDSCIKLIYHDKRRA